MPVALDAGRTTHLELGLRWDSAGDGSITLRSAAATANTAGIEAAPCADGLAVCVTVPPGAITTEPVRIDAVVADDDGDADAHAASFGVFVPTELTVLTCVREVPVRPNNASAYPAQTLDINDCVAGAGTRGVRFFDGAGGEIAEGRLTYVPPAGRMSVFVSAPPESIRRPVSPTRSLIAFSAEYADAGTGRTSAKRNRRDPFCRCGRRRLDRRRGAGRCGLVRAAVRVDAAADGLRQLPRPARQPDRLSRDRRRGRLRAACAAASTGAIRSRPRTC